MIKTSIFKIQVTCPGCGIRHAVSGITDTENCHQCGKTISISGVLNNRMFGVVNRENYLNAYLAGNIEQIGGNDAYKLEYTSQEPYCEQCYTQLEHSALLDAINNGKPYKCSSCNHIMPVRPADAAVKEFHPKAIGVINDAYGIDAGSKAADKEIMLVFKCMTCGSGLELTEKTARTTKCSYCDNDNYLPDAIWSKLHPNKEVQPLFVLLELDENDIKGSIDYFIRITMLAIFEKHFENFVREYFERPFITDAFLTWLKYFLSAEDSSRTGHVLKVSNPQRSFLNNIKLGYDSHPEQLRQTAAEYALSIPSDLQHLFAGDKSDNVRLALARNKSLDKEVIKKLQNDINILVSTQAKKNKKGFLKSLFG